MKPDPRVDQHGFPIPPGFDDQPGKEPARKLGTRRGRWVVIALLVAVIASLVVESPLSSTGRQWAAAWCRNLAQENLDHGDLPGAISKLGWAIRVSPDTPGLYKDRARLRLAANDLEGSLADYSRTIELNPKDAHLYLQRSAVYQRMDRTSDALADLNQAVKRSHPNDPLPLNARAYGRALAGVELKEGMADIEKALKLVGKENGMFIDTRAWLRFRMGEYKAALEDMNRAIELTHKDREREIEILAGHHVSPREIEEREREYETNLAVMHHHRGEIYQKLGEKKQAASDLKLGDKLGYDPANGVF